MVRLRNELLEKVPDCRNDSVTNTQDRVQVRPTRSSQDQRGQSNLKTSQLVPAA